MRLWRRYGPDKLSGHLVSLTRGQPAACAHLQMRARLRCERRHDEGLAGARRPVAHTPRSPCSKGNRRKNFLPAGTARPWVARWAVGAARSNLQHVHMANTWMTQRRHAKHASDAHRASLAWVPRAANRRGWRSGSTTASRSAAFCFQRPPTVAKPVAAWVCAAMSALRGAPAVLSCNVLPLAPSTACCCVCRTAAGNSSRPSPHLCKRA